MAVSLFLTFEQDVHEADRLAKWFCGEPLSVLRNHTLTHSVELFTPALDEVPAFDDGIGPALLVQLDLANRANAAELLEAPRFAEILARGDVKVDVFERKDMPLVEGEAPPPRTAALSFCVRYYRPTDDPESFIREYLAHHPLHMRDFPGIRNIICYLPVSVSGIEQFSTTTAFFGNEVVFDDLTALNTALASPVLKELKSGLEKMLPVRRNTHYAMHRRSLDLN